MEKLVDGMGKPITIGDTFLYKGRHSWRYGIIRGISMKYGQMTIHVIMAQKYYTGEEYHYHSVGLTTTAHIYKTDDIPEKVSQGLRRKVVG